MYDSEDYSSKKDERRQKLKRMNVGRKRSCHLALYLFEIQFVSWTSERGNGKDSLERCLFFCPSVCLAVGATNGISKAGDNFLRDAQTTREVGPDG